MEDDTWGAVSALLGGAVIVFGAILLLVHLYRSGQARGNQLDVVRWIAGEPPTNAEVLAELVAHDRRRPSSSAPPSTFTLTPRAGFPAVLLVCGIVGAAASMGQALAWSAGSPRSGAMILFTGPVTAALLAVWYADRAKRITVHVTEDAVRFSRRGEAEAVVAREDIWNIGLLAADVSPFIAVWCPAGAELPEEVFGEPLDERDGTVRVLAGQTKRLPREGIDALRATFADRWVIADAAGKIRRGVRHRVGAPFARDAEPAYEPLVHDDLSGPLSPEDAAEPPPSRVTVGKPRFALPAVVGALSAVLFTLSGPLFTVPIGKDGLRMLGYVSAAFAVPWLVIGVRRMFLGHAVRVDEAAIHVSKGFRTLRIPRSSVAHVGLLPPGHDPALGIWSNVRADEIGDAFPVVAEREGLTVIRLEQTGPLPHDKLLVLRRIFGDRWVVGDGEGGVLPPRE